jgi:esterase/lipase superfamily enzyme
VDLNRREQLIPAPSVGGAGRVLAYGHWGRPMLVFASQEGRPEDYEDRGMIAAVGDQIEAGRVKVYAVESFDSSSWHHHGLELEERAERHGLYEDWIVDQVAPWIRDDCGGEAEIIVTGCSFGAYHAANFALKRADLFPLALCHSGVYDVAVVGGGRRGDAVYFNNPMDYVSNLGGDHVDWLRGRVSLLIVCGQGQWEDTTGALESSKRFAGLLAEKAIPHELDLWGYDVPHDWPSWRAQLAHHLPRFV